MNILGLPSETVHAIAAVDPRSRLTLKQVSKRFYLLISELVHSTTVFCTLQSDIEYLIRRPLPFLNSLRVPYINTVLWNAIARRCPFLESLSVDLSFGMLYAFNPAVDLLSMPMLQKLVLARGTGLFMLPSCPNLAHLECADLDGASNLFSLTSLKHFTWAANVFQVRFQDLDVLGEFLLKQVGGPLREISIRFFRKSQIMVPILKRLLPQLHSFRFDASMADPTYSLEECAYHCPQLTSLKLFSFRYSSPLPNLSAISAPDVDLNALEALLDAHPKVQRLGYCFEEVNPSIVFTKRPNLTYLDFGCLSDVSDPHQLFSASQLLAFPSLRTLYVNGFDLDVTALHSLVNLTFLSAGAGVITPQQPMVECRSLTNLKFSTCNNVSRLLLALPCLQHLTTSSAVDLNSLQHLSALVSLKTRVPTVEDFQGLRWMLPDLELLHLGTETPSSWDLLATDISKLRYLRDLSLSDGNLSAEALETIMTSVPLRHLSLSCVDSEFSDQHLRMIANHGQSLISFSIEGIESQYLSAFYLTAGALSRCCLKSAFHASRRSNSRKSTLPPCLELSVERYTLQYETESDSDLDSDSA